MVRRRGSSWRWDSWRAHVDKRLHTLERFVAALCGQFATRSVLELLWCLVLGLTQWWALWYLRIVGPPGHMSAAECWDEAQVSGKVRTRLAWHLAPAFLIWGFLAQLLRSL